MSTKRSYLSKVVVEMPDSGIKDFFDIANTMDGALSLGVGEPDFQTPEHVRRRRSLPSGALRQSILTTRQVPWNCVRRQRSIWKSSIRTMTGRMRFLHNGGKRGD